MSRRRLNILLIIASVFCIIMFASGARFYSQIGDLPKVQSVPESSPFGQPELDPNLKPAKFNKFG